MSWTVRVVAVLTFLVASSCATIAIAAVQVGDPFYGTLSLDPNAPVTVYNANTIYSYGDLPPTPPLRVIRLTLGVETFTIPVGIVDDEMRQDGTWLWVLQAFGAGSINLIFSGPTPSTSILPLDFSLYPPNNLFSQYLDGINIRASLNTGGQHLDLAGQITSLIKTDDEGDFSFGGALVSVSFREVSSIPEPSTWAMLLIGFAGIGLAAYRRKISVAMVR
jgi:hypothetical protein